MSDLLDLNAVEARNALDEKLFRRLNWQRLIWPQRTTSNLNNYVELTADHALAMAAVSDKRIAEARPDYGGLAIGVKDLFALKG